MTADDLADVALLRAAGFGPELDTEHLYPPAKWAAQPGHMPTVADLVAELAKVRGLLEALIVGGVHTYKTSWGGQACVYCIHIVPGPAPFDLLDPKRHAESCPWRQATEYAQGLEASK